MNSSVTTDASQVNTIVKRIADLGSTVTATELQDGGSANDLRDSRQAAVEQLAGLVNSQQVNNSDNTINLSIGGVTFIDHNQVVDSMITQPDPNAANVDTNGVQGVVLATQSGTAFTTPISGGSIQGTIDARDGTILQLSNNINSLASTLITQVNTIHSSGTGLNGTTGENFFNGTNASDIAINPAMTQDPNQIQASSTGAPGDNGIALQLAQLGETSLGSLGNETFASNYNQTVAAFGQEVSNTDSQSTDQQTVSNMLLKQRDSLGGVSIDEEMSNLVIYQRAYEASAHMISTMDEMLQSVLALQ